MKKGELYIASLAKGTKANPGEKTRLEKKSTGETITWNVEDDIYQDSINFLGAEKVFAYYKDGKNYCLVVDERADFEKMSGKAEKYIYSKK